MNPFDKMLNFQKKVDSAFDSFFNDKPMLNPIKDIKMPNFEDKKKDSLKCINLEPGVHRKDIITNPISNLIQIKSRDKIKIEDVSKQELLFSGFFDNVPLPVGVRLNKYENDYTGQTFKVLTAKKDDSLLK